MMMETKKPSIVLVHGFRGTHLGLASVADYLKKAGYKVYMPDLPPFGDSAEMTEYTPSQYADFIKKYLEQNKIKSPVLVGHSMGSIVVAAAAEKYPKLIYKKVVLMSPISVRPAKFFANLTPLITLLPDDFVTWLSTMYLFVPKDRAMFREVLALSCVCGRSYKDRKEVKKAARFSSNYAISDFDLAKQNVIMIAGKKDRLIPRAKTTELARKIKAKVVYLPNSGHLINYECPEKVGKTIIDFLAE